MRSAHTFFPFAHLSKALFSCTLLFAGCGSPSNQPMVSFDKDSQTARSPLTQPEPQGDGKKKPAAARTLRRLGATEIASIKPIDMKTGRFEECGVETYHQRADQLCGVDQFKLSSSELCPPVIKEDPQFGARTFRLGRGEACGAEEYFAKPDESCGADSEEFWSEWNKSCTSGYAAGSWFSALAKTETRVHYYSAFDIRVETRHLCKKRTLRTCARPEFGVKQYKECRHESFGAENFNSGVVGYEACRNPSHGVESYKMCRHETFGVETYKSCSLYMTQPEMDGYLRAQADIIPALQTTLLDTAAIFYSSAGKQRALACLVKEIVEDPKQKELAEDLKSRYYILTDRFWSESEANQCAHDFVEIDDAECADNDISMTCTALRSFRTVQAAMRTTRKNLMLLSEEAHKRGSKASADAVQGLLDAARNK
jgi:hypothetical protein